MKLIFPKDVCVTVKQPSHINNFIEKKKKKKIKTNKVTYSNKDKSLSKP